MGLKSGQFSHLPAGAVQRGGLGSQRSPGEKVGVINAQVAPPHTALWWGTGFLKEKKGGEADGHRLCNRNST